MPAASKFVTALRKAPAYMDDIMGLAGRKMQEMPDGFRRSSAITDGAKGALGLIRSFRENPRKTALGLAGSVALASKNKGMVAANVAGIGRLGIKKNKRPKDIGNMINMVRMGIGYGIGDKETVRHGIKAHNMLNKINLGEAIKRKTGWQY